METPTRVNEPAIHWLPMHSAEHFVQFYDETAHLCESVSRYIGSGLSGDMACVIVAAEAHVDEVERVIRSQGIDLEPARQRGQYLVLNGDAILKQLVFEGRLQRDNFFELIGQVIRNACAHYSSVRVYSELVATLCSRGNHSAAQTLESLWHELARQQPFALFCAYPMNCFNTHQHGEAFAHASACHERVIPAENYSAEPNAVARLQVVSKLQQKAKALEHEIERRKWLEQKLVDREQELSDFIEHASEAMHKVDANGKLLWANKAELQLLGYTAADYIGRHYLDFQVHPALAQQSWRTLLMGQTQRDRPAQLRCKDGSIKHVLVSSTSYWEAGEFLYTRCISRDISDQIRAEQVLQEEARAWQILNCTGAELANELRPEKVGQIIIDAAVALSRATCGAFFYKVADGDDDSYLLQSFSGAPRETFAGFPLLRDCGLFASVFAGKGCVRIADIEQQPAFPTVHMPMAVRSYLVTPVMSHSGKVCGALCLGHPEPGAFTATDELIAGGIAAQATIAMDNARLFTASQHVQQQLSALNETLEQRIQERSAELRRTELQLSRLVDGVVDYAIYMLDSNGHVVSWNTGAERIKGYSREEIIGRHFSVFYTEQDRLSGLPQHALEAATQVGKYEADGWRVRKGGNQFWASVLLDAMHDENGKLLGFAKVTRDMTERRMLEDRLYQAQKMEAIGQLTGGVAHDFNNVLTIILGNLDSILRWAPDNHRKLHQAIDNATRGAQRAATLTQQLLAFARRQALNPKPTDINRLVASMTDLLRRTLGESIAIETCSTASNEWVEIDSHQLETALLNLAVNARDAMQVSGGKLVIATSNLTVDEQRDAAATELGAGEYVVISVSDSGVGMSAEVVERAFDPFFTTKTIGQGSGLGLSQVYGFVKQSGGHVKILSEPNMGTTINIYLQQMAKSQAKALESDTNATVVVPRSKGDETILVVEDDTDVRQYTVSSLHELGFTVLEAAEATTALRMLDEHPEVQLLFADVGLPGMNGRELAQQAHLHRPALKILLTSGYARGAFMNEGRIDTGVELLPKPFTRVQLANRIREVLDAGLRAERPAVLVVDDEALIAQFLAETLEDMGFRVVQAGTVAAALDIARAPEQSLAAALVDLGLPDRSGLELIAELQKLRPRLPVLIATGYAAMAKRDLGEDHQPPNYLAKPYNAESISKALCQLGIKIPQRLLN